jgi:hypothetical protein
MADNYRIRRNGSEFMVSDDCGTTVGVYGTKQEAQQIIEVCEHDDFMFKTAKGFVQKAVYAFMRKHRVDRRTAHDWIREAAD